jgi:hypothetical protein
MCFSASASFGAGIVLTVIGVASLKKVQHPSQKFFASIPLIFGFQQISEGFLWLALSNEGFDSLQQVSTHVFLFLAQVVWPVWVPFAFLMLEEKAERKKSAKLLTGIGGVVSAYLAFCLLSYPVEGKIVGYHISYTQDYPAALALYGGLLYLISTIAPPFLSKIKNMWILGTAIFISYIITQIFYDNSIVSVWCFFAAVISMLVLYYCMQLKSQAKLSIQNPPTPCKQT